MKIRLTTGVLLFAGILVGGFLPVPSAWAREPIREFLDDLRQRLMPDMELQFEEIVSQYFSEAHGWAWSPLEYEHRIPGQLVILDGLDELSSAGEASTVLAREFTRRVKVAVRSMNEGDKPIRVLLTGRNVAAEFAAETLGLKPTLLRLLPV